MKEVFVAKRDESNRIRTDYDLMLELIRESGMDYNWSKMFVKKLADDERTFFADEKTKKWALERGFYPGRVELYGLTEENYKDFIPDYSYFMLHPLNHHFRKWLDKLTLKYVLNSNGCDDSMPEYYLYVENNGNYTYLMDLDNDIPKDKDFILNLLKAKGILAVKPNSGSSGGRGFMKIEWVDGKIIVNNSEITMDEFQNIISNIGNNIVTEYCIQNKKLADIWSASECTLRVTMAKMPKRNIWDESEWHNIISYARFGSSMSGGASNMSSGGVGIGFDFETGKFKDSGIRYKRFCEDGNIVSFEHPDTHVKWKDFVLPNWEFVKNKIYQICNHIDSLDYLGIDIIITEDGMKLCEINSHPAMDNEQILCNPVFNDKKAKEFFEYHGIEKVDNSKLYEIYSKCQKK